MVPRAMFTVTIFERSSNLSRSSSRRKGLSAPPTGLSIYNCFRTPEMISIGCNNGSVRKYDVKTLIPKLNRLNNDNITQLTRLIEKYIADLNVAHCRPTVPGWNGCIQCQRLAAAHAADIADKFLARTHEDKLLREELELEAAELVDLLIQI